MRSDAVYLAYIKECIRLIREYVAGGEPTFRGDMRTRDAVLRCMETLADAANHLSPILKDRHAEIA